MENDSEECVDMYIPRKCSASNRIIHAKDHASIQINIADVDEATGSMTGTYKSYAICGDLRRMGESDDAISKLAIQDGIMKM
ncbi:RPS21 [Cordylochernes scorpioides]|uniref:40S ribosomal protein S21 n=1 Tax=Cordylochernes scorpioides TaxID=51811 RepID=A0ABY6LVN6_9ARAC|nr:RPS21 [Cordylochernes scorpioides]